MQFEETQKLKKYAVQVFSHISQLLISVCEYVSTLSIYILSPFLRTKVSYPNSRIPQIPRGTLIISNHQSMLDPFFIVHYLGPRNVLRNTPLRFPTTSDFMRSPFFRYPLILLGCFDVGEKSLERMKGLLRIRDFIRKKTTLLIFPEGKIIRDPKDLGIFEKGINFLIQEETPILLVRIDGMRTWSFLNFSKRYQTEITFSELLPPTLKSHEKFIFIQEFFERSA